MHTRFILTFILGLLPLCTLHAQNPGATTPDEIVRQLTNSDYRIAFSGVESYVSLSPDQRTPAMKTALVQALKNEIERIRQIELRSDEPSLTYKDHGSAEMAFFLVEEVVALKDPATIPLLLHWRGFNDEKIDFGRQAFEPVLKFLEMPPPGATRNALIGNLFTLRMMVDYWGLGTFSMSERMRMKQVAAKYIVDYDPNPEKNSHFQIIRAVSLAASLQEASLLHMAAALVNNDAELAKRGFGGLAITRLQENATKALAGTLEERQHRPFEERRRH